MDGCFSPSGEALSSKETDLEDIVIVKRETQVVRAVEPRTGSEKWNFSVSTHHLTFQPGKILERPTSRTNICCYFVLTSYIQY